MNPLFVPAAFVFGAFVGAFIVANTANRRIVTFLAGMAVLARTTPLADPDGEPTLEDWKALGRAQGQVMAYSKIADLIDRVLL